MNFNTVLYPVKDIDQARVTFTSLFGVEPRVDSPYYVGYSINGSEIGLVPGGHDQGMAGPEAFYDVEDITGTLNALKAAGAAVVQESRDVGRGLLVARARDTEGNIIGLKQFPAS